MTEAELQPPGQGGRPDRAGSSRLHHDLATRRRRQIMTAAFDVISTEGLGAARLADIAEVAGLSLGSIQHYFRKRDQLVTETFRSLIELSGAIWRHVSRTESDPLRRLFALLRLQASGWAPFERRWTFWFEFWGAARRIDELKAHVSEIYASWQWPFEEALTEGAEAGVLRLREPVAVYSLKLMAIIDGFAIRALVDAGNFGEHQMSEMLLATVCQDLSISADDFAAALDGLPEVIGIAYPAETPIAERIDWSPLDRAGGQ